MSVRRCDTAAHEAACTRECGDARESAMARKFWAVSWVSGSEKPRPPDSSGGATANTETLSWVSWPPCRKWSPRDLRAIRVMSLRSLSILLDRSGVNWRYYSKRDVNMAASSCLHRPMSGACNRRLTSNSDVRRTMALRCSVSPAKLIIAPR